MLEVEEAYHVSWLCKCCASVFTTTKRGLCCSYICTRHRVHNLKNSEACGECGECMFYAWQVNELFLLACGESEVRVGSLVTGRGAWWVSCLGFVLTGSDGLDGMSWVSVDVRGGYGRGRYGGGTVGCTVV
jgi:hypothetical protein